MWGDAKLNVVVVRVLERLQLKVVKRDLLTNKLNIKAIFLDGQLGVVMGVDGVQVTAGFTAADDVPR